MDEFFYAVPWVETHGYSHRVATRPLATDETRRFILSPARRADVDADVFRPIQAAPTMRRLSILVRVPMQRASYGEQGKKMGRMVAQPFSSRSATCEGRVKWSCPDLGISTVPSSTEPAMSGTSLSGSQRRSNAIGKASDRSKR